MKIIARKSLIYGFVAICLPLLAWGQGFENPLKADTLSDLLALIIDGAILILMPLVVLAIIYSGFMFLMAQGNEQKLKTAKTNFLWVIIGVAVLLGAKIISEVLKATADTVIK